MSLSLVPCPCPSVPCPLSLSPSRPQSLSADNRSIAPRGPPAASRKPSRYTSATSSAAYPSAAPEQPSLAAKPRRSFPRCCSRAAGSWITTGTCSPCPGGLCLAKCGLPAGAADYFVGWSEVTFALSPPPAAQPSPAPPSTPLHSPPLQPVSAPSQSVPQLLLHGADSSTPGSGSHCFTFLASPLGKGR